MSIHVVLVHPEIHWNTGNAGRTCLATGATLHLIEPLGFSLDEKQVKRAGLDFFSTKATQPLWDAPLGKSADIVLVFGRETGGLAPEIHDKYRDRFVTMPLASPLVRSLNLSTAVGIAIYEVLRQRRAVD